MNLGNKMKARDAKNSPAMAVFAAVFAMFIVSAVLLLLLAVLLYKLEPGESVIRIGVIVVYVVSGLTGGLLAGKIMKERKYFWGLLTGLLYFAILFIVSAIVGGGLDMELAKVFATAILCGASGMAGGMLS